MTFNTIPKFAGAFFNWLSRIGCGLLVMQAFAAPLPAVDLLYVSSASNNNIVTYDTTGNDGVTIAATMTTFASTNLSCPQDLAFDSTGNLYASNGCDRTISKFNSSGGYVSNMTSNLSNPCDLAFDSTGNLYVSNILDNTISKFGCSGAYLGNISSNVPPGGLAFDTSGNLYAGSGSNTINKFNASDIYISSITSNLSIATGLAFDSSGNLYAANTGNNTISKFDSSGTFITSWSTGGASGGIAFKPVSVPEPSTYALAAIATGVMAYLSRRRKARTA